MLIKLEINFKCLEGEVALLCKTFCVLNKKVFGSSVCYSHDEPGTEGKPGL